MGKSLPRKCNACAKTIKNNFVRHAKACPAGFTKWTFLAHAGDAIPKTKLKKVANRIHDATDGERADRRKEIIDDHSRSWRKLKRLGVPACNWPEIIAAITHLFGLVRARPDVTHRKLVLLHLELSKPLTKRAPNYQF